MQKKYPKAFAGRLGTMLGITLLNYKQTLNHMLYIPYGGNFGSGKIWRIHYMNILAEENLADCEIFQMKISRKTFRKT